MSSTVPIVNNLYNCCIKDCCSRQKNVILHRMPSNKKKLQRWLECIDSDELRGFSLDDIRKLFVCHKHFEKRFITNNYCLLTTAYPTLFSAYETFSGIPTKIYKDENLNPNTDHSQFQNVDHDHSYCNSNLTQDMSKRFPVSDTKMPLSSNTMDEINKCPQAFYNTDPNKPFIPTVKVQRSGHSKKFYNRAARVRSEIMSVKHRCSTFPTNTDYTVPITVDADEGVIKIEDDDEEDTCHDDDVQEVPNESETCEIASNAQISKTAGNVQMLENTQAQTPVNNNQGHRTFMIGKRRDVVLNDAQVQAITSNVQGQNTCVPHLQNVLGNGQVLGIVKNDHGQNVILVQKQNIHESGPVQEITHNAQEQEVNCNAQQKKTINMSKVQKPANAFAIFCKCHRSIIKQCNPKLDKDMVSEILRDWWDILDPTKKLKYNEMACEINQRSSLLKSIKEAHLVAYPERNIDGLELSSNSPRPQSEEPPAVLPGIMEFVDVEQSDHLSENIDQNMDPIPATQDTIVTNGGSLNVIYEANKGGRSILKPIKETYKCTQANSVPNISFHPKVVKQSNSQVRRYCTVIDSIQPSLTINPIKPIKKKSKCRNCIRAKQRRKTQKVTKKDYFDKFTAKLHPAAKQFIWMQLKNATRKNHGRRFTLDEKLLCIAIFEQSQKCYKFLRKIFLLPSRSSLQNCLKEHCAIIDADDPQAPKQEQVIHEEVAPTHMEEIDFAVLDEFPDCFQDEMGSAGVYQTLEIS